VETLTVRLVLHFGDYKLNPVLSVVEKPQTEDRYVSISRLLFTHTDLSPRSAAALAFVVPKTEPRSRQIK
jgi:hypothetical protein